MYILNYLGYYSTKIIHVGITSFIVLGPFIIKAPYDLGIHSVISSLILLHWKYNSDACCLTALEHYFRKLINKTGKIEECFTYKIISPIYNFNQNYKKYNLFSYIAMGFLFCISYGRFLFLRRDKIIRFYKKYNSLIDFSFIINVICSVLFLL